LPREPLRWSERAGQWHQKSLIFNDLNLNTLKRPLHWRPAAQTRGSVSDRQATRSHTGVNPDEARREVEMETEYGASMWAEVNEDGS